MSKIQKTSQAPTSTTATEISLPDVSDQTSSFLESITSSLGVSRDVLPKDEQIGHVWDNLPRLLSKIPTELRNEGTILLCVAVASGLFASAVNFIWNAAILELQEKVRRFGLNIVPQVIGADFDEKTLVEYQDSHLLSFCLKLNLISEDGYFMLDQCRDIRNKFSAAHPTIGKIDEDELINFISRCQKYALSEAVSPKGVDIKGLIIAVNGSKFTQAQMNIWIEKIKGTFDAQRELLLETLHGIYCDPSSSEESRVNSINLCSNFSETITPRSKSTLIDRHHSYQQKGDEQRHKASQQFFERMSFLSLLNKTERHSMISNACNSLISVHDAMDNFYNEPPFAERLYALTNQQDIPETVQHKFVESVVLCGIGNQYGVSHAAYSYYSNMVRGFSPREISIMLDLYSGGSRVSNRVSSFIKCRKAFVQLIKLVDAESIPTQSKNFYQSLISE